MASLLSRVVSCSFVPVLALPASTPQQFLRSVIGLTSDQLGAVERGDVVTRQLEAQDRPEAVAFGVARLAADADSFEHYARDVVRSHKNPHTLQIGVFGKTPRVEDLEALTIPEGDFDDIQKCKPGDCDVMLSAALMARFKSELNRSTPEGRARAVALVKEMMVGYVKSYLEGGTASMAVYNDGAQPTELSKEFHTILSRSSYLVEYLPEFHKYVEDYPLGKLEGAEDVLYWTKEDFGLKPVISMNHVTIYKEPPGRPASVVVSTKQLYASHYFRTALGISAAVPGTGVIYLMALERARINPPGGMLAGVLLGKVRGGIEKGVGLKLKAAKANLETPSPR
jgi:hypothetical protein